MHKDTLTITVRDRIHNEVFENLLYAHGRLAEEGSAREVIELTEYLFKYAKVHGEMLIELPMKEEGANAETTTFYGDV